MPFWGCTVNFCAGESASRVCVGAMGGRTFWLRVQLRTKCATFTPCSMLKCTKWHPCIPPPLVTWTEHLARHTNRCRTPSMWLLKLLPVFFRCRLLGLLLSQRSDERAMPCCTSMRQTRQAPAVSGFGRSAGAPCSHWRNVTRMSCCSGMCGVWPR